MRSFALAAVLVTSGCGFALQADGEAPRECGLEGRPIAWSGKYQLGAFGIFGADGFPDERVGDVWVTEAAEPEPRSFCAHLPAGAEPNCPCWTTGIVPDDWRQPAGS